MLFTETVFILIGFKIVHPEFRTWHAEKSSYPSRSQQHNKNCNYIWSHLDNGI